MNSNPILASVAQDISNLRSDVQELHRHITSARKLTHRNYIIEQLQPIPGLTLLEKSALASTIMFLLFKKCDGLLNQPPERISVVTHGDRVDVALHNIIVVRGDMNRLRGLRDRVEYETGLL
ncbi:hypothetical protein HBH53_063870 [Parastagonospora nodorum]|nr:hypothetical protein HBH53_063870 [Parastagonospora nodorum]